MWTLTSPETEGVGGSKRFDLPNNSSVHIVLNGVLVRAVHASGPGANDELGRINVGPWGLKLEAVHNYLTVVPSYLHTDSTTVAKWDSRIAKYELQPCSEGRAEVMILRHGDVIHFPKSASSLTCKWVASEVQVDSSVAESRTVQKNCENSEEETEDEERPSMEATGTHKLNATPVPRLSNQRSVIVQETPTAARILIATEASNESSSSSEVANSAGEIADSETHSASNTGNLQPREADTPDTTAQVPYIRNKENVELPTATHIPSPNDMSYEEGVQSTKNSPRVEIRQKVSRKRDSPNSNPSDLELQTGDGSRLHKRAKTHAKGQNTIQDSQMSTIDADDPSQIKTLVVAKLKKRKSESFEPPADTTLRSQRNSQRSNTAAADSYHGPSPRVAVSNSGITRDTQAAKFLRKHGGVLIDSIKEQFNILCVRDGDLTKTSKLLVAIARGIPIVTDKWLFDSAKAGHFLATADYIPSAPKQEQEWNIKLSQIIGHPKTPFQGYTIHFTSSLKAAYKPFADIEHVCKAAGAKKITSTRMEKSRDIVVLAKDEQDPDVIKLMQEGITCYSRDLITQSILRGSVDLQSAEFQITVQDKNALAPQEKKKRGRKSK